MNNRSYEAERPVLRAASNEQTARGRARARRSPKRESAWPRGLRPLDAADYAGISPTTYDAWVKERRLPAPKKIGGVVLTDRYALDDALDVLFGSEAEAQMDAWNDVRV